MMKLTELLDDCEWDAARLDLSQDYKLKDLDCAGVDIEKLTSSPLFKQLLRNETIQSALLVEYFTQIIKIIALESIQDKYPKTSFYLSQLQLYDLKLDGNILKLYLSQILNITENISQLSLIINMIPDIFPLTDELIDKLTIIDIQPAVINALEQIELSDEQDKRIDNILLSQINSIKIENLPIIISYLLKKKENEKSIERIRAAIRLEVYFPSSDYLELIKLIETFGNLFRFDKLLFAAYLKQMKKEVRMIDLMVVCCNYIESKKLSSILHLFFNNLEESKNWIKLLLQVEYIREVYLDQLLRVACEFQSDFILRELIRVEKDKFNLRTIQTTLVELIVNGRRKELLGVLKETRLNDFNAIKLLIEDYMDIFTVDELEIVYDLLVNNCSNVNMNDLLILIRKELFHKNQSFKMVGIAGGLKLLEKIHAVNGVKDAFELFELILRACDSCVCMNFCLQRLARLVSQTESTELVEFVNEYGGDVFQANFVTTEEEVKVRYLLDQENEVKLGLKSLLFQANCPLPESKLHWLQPSLELIKQIELKLRGNVEEVDALLTMGIELYDDEEEEIEPHLKLCLLIYATLYVIQIINMFSSSGTNVWIRLRHLSELERQIEKVCEQVDICHLTEIYPNEELKALQIKLRGQKTAKEARMVPIPFKELVATFPSIEYSAFFKMLQSYSCEFDDDRSLLAFFTDQFVASLDKLQGDKRKKQLSDASLEFAEMAKQDKLIDALMVVVENETQQIVPQTKLLVKLLKLFKTLSGMNLSPKFAYLIELMEKPWESMELKVLVVDLLVKSACNDEDLAKVHKICSVLLTQSDQTHLGNDQLEFLLKYSEEFESLENIADYSTRVFPALFHNDADVLEAYPHLNKQSFAVYHKTILAQLSDLLKDNYKDLEWLKDYAGCLVANIQLLRDYETKAIMLNTLRYGRVNIEMFTKHAFATLQNKLKSDTQEVFEVLKVIQQGTRIMQSACNQAKEFKDTQLNSVVPQTRKALEGLIFGAKNMMGKNKALNAFWLGNLKHKSIQGEVMSSQMPVSVVEEDETEEKNEPKRKKRKKKEKLEEIDEEEEDEQSKLSATYVVSEEEL